MSTADFHSPPAHTEDFGHEPVPGLPQVLPPGERILWQGRPQWRPFARHAFLLVPVAVYFLALTVWRTATAIEDGMAGVELAKAALWPLAAGGVIVLAGGWLARYAARTTVYTITTRRLVLKVGMALTVSVNLPFSRIQSAALRRRRDGSGDIVLEILKPARVSWIMLWPHVRGLYLRHPRPVLRNLAEPERVAQVLGRALAASAAMPAPVIEPAIEPAPAARPASPANRPANHPGAEPAVA